MTGSIGVLIADDHPVVRMGLRGMLAGQPDFEVVGEAETGGAAVELTELLRPNVVLMDLRMAEMDGVRRRPGSRTGGPRPAFSCSPPRIRGRTSCGP